MKAVSFLHQKGGTGKSTLAVAAAVALAQRGERPLLLDADYQGTAGEWGNRFGHERRVETLAHVQPDLHERLASLADGREWLLIDGPPSLSPMTESILRASTRVIIPVRPALPDLWALTWPAAMIAKLRKTGQAPETLVVINMYRGEPLEPLVEQITELQLAVHEQPIPADPVYAALFSGAPLPDEPARLMLELIGA
jgi:chromosome partitioning protein